LTRVSNARCWTWSCACGPRTRAAWCSATTDRRDQMGRRSC
jgi:hypothetical protein